MLLKDLLVNGGVAPRVVPEASASYFVDAPRKHQVQLPCKSIDELQAFNEKLGETAGPDGQDRPVFDDFVSMKLIIFIELSNVIIKK